MSQETSPEITQAQHVPEGVVEVKEGETAPEGYVPFTQILESKLEQGYEEARRSALEKKGIRILGVPADEAREMALELLNTAPEQVTRFLAAASWLLLNQTDTVDRIGIAVQDMLVFMNQQPGQLNTRNYVITNEPTATTNLRMDYKGRVGDLTQDTVYSYSYQVVSPSSPEEYEGGPEAYSKVLALPRATHYHLINQLMMLDAPMDVRTFYISYSVADQDPMFASKRAEESANPPLDKDPKGDMLTNIKLN